MRVAHPWSCFDDRRHEVRCGVGVGVEHVGRDARCRGSGWAGSGSSLASSASKSTSVWPNFSPRPLNAVRDAPSVSLSLAGSILSSTDDQLLEDRVDLDGDVLALDHLAGAAASRSMDRPAASSSTNLAPNTVEDAMSTPTLAGIRSQLRRDPSPGAGRRCRPGAVSMDCDLADLHAAHLDLGVGVHHQAGAVGDHRHRNGFR